MLIAVSALILLATESMFALSGVRAYVGGEGLWSKAQKDAIYYLVRYAHYGDALDYKKYEAAIAVPLGDRQAREALDRPARSIDYEAARRGFLQGKNNAADIDAMSAIFVHLRHWSYIENAIDIWAKADRLIERVRADAAELQPAMRGSKDPARIEQIVTNLQALNDQLRPLEDAFSYTLGEASRWATRVLVISLCLLGVLMVMAATFPYARELSRSMNAEAALRLADRRKDEFIATLAHELRNPLAPIRNALEIMRLLGNASAEHTAARSIIDRQTRHLTRLVDDLLEVSRFTRGEVELRNERVNLSVPVNDAVEAVQPLVRSLDQSLTVSLPTVPIHLECDPTRITQVVLNLLNNAAKFTPRGGRIWLSVERDGNHAIIRVRDTGIGIPAQHISRLFEMFSQVSPPLERSHGGLGIGLALARGLVTLHGGSIEARSEGAGKGSEFVVRLPMPPVTEQNDAQTAAAPEFARQAARYKVLVVDDNHDAADSLCELLRLYGHEPVKSYDGGHAILEAKRFRPDVVMLDIGLPGLNGYQTAREIRRQAGEHAPTMIAITGWGQDEDRQRAADAGFAWHLTKPVDPPQLQTLLDAMWRENQRPGREGCKTAT
jgi:signal transduction histidine kinase/CheY-like chemotaxis protein